MSTICNCTLDTADSKNSILNFKKNENLVVDLSMYFNKLLVNDKIEIDSIVNSNELV
jgi:hypothetical protein